MTIKGRHSEGYPPNDEPTRAEQLVRNGSCSQRYLLVDFTNATPTKKLPS